MSLARGRSLPFIIPSAAPSSSDDESDGKGGGDEPPFELGAEALALLASLSLPVAVVAVAGRYRTGKSFLLNRLIGERAAFGVGNTVEAFTRGINLWSQPLLRRAPDGAPYLVLFLDTEGISSSAANEEHDARVFSLAVLLSSLIVFNSVGAIDEDAIAGLGFVANLTRHIQTQSDEASAANGGPDDVEADQLLEEDADDTDGAAAVAPAAAFDSDDDTPRKPGPRASRRPRLRPRPSLSTPLTSPGATASSVSLSSSAAALASASFPAFLWVLRDFSLDLRDPDSGEQLLPREYLEQCLAQQPSYSSDSQGRNRVRRVLTGCFRRRDCATLVRPVDDEAALAFVDTMPERELRPAFRQQLDALRTLVLDDLARPKVAPRGAELVTGRMLGGLARAYVSAINNKAVPSIGGAWADVSRAECLEASAAALAVYEGALASDAHAGTLPFDDAALEALHGRHRAASLAAFEARAVGPSVPRYRDELEGKIAARAALLRAANAAASDAACAALVQALWLEIVEPHAPFYLLSNGGGASDSLAPAPSSRALAGAASPSLDDDLRRLRQAYFDSARGPAVHSALARFLAGSSALPRLLRAAGLGLRAEAQARVARLEARAGELQAQLAAERARAQVLERQCADLGVLRTSREVEAARAVQEAEEARGAAAAAEDRAAAAVAQHGALEALVAAERRDHARLRLRVRRNVLDEAAAEVEYEAEKPRALNGHRRDAPKAASATAAAPEPVSPMAAPESIFPPISRGIAGIGSRGKIAFPEIAPVGPAGGCGCALA